MISRNTAICKLSRLLPMVREHLEALQDLIDSGELKSDNELICSKSRFLYSSAKFNEIIDEIMDGPIPGIYIINENYIKEFLYLMLSKHIHLNYSMLSAATKDAFANIIYIKYPNEAKWIMALLRAKAELNDYDFITTFNQK